jgi:hypothetical protein
MIGAVRAQGALYESAPLKTPGRAAARKVAGEQSGPRGIFLVDVLA